MRDADFAKVSAHSAGTRRSAFLWWLIWILWMPFIIPNINTFITSHPAPLRLVLSLTAVAVFFVLYLTLNWRTAVRAACPTPSVMPTGAALWTPIAVMLALAVTLTLVDGPVWGSLFIYMSTCAAGWLPLREAAFVIAGIVAYTLIGISSHGSIGDAVSPLAFIVVPGLVVLTVVRSLSVNQQLRAVREEMAGAAAVNEERLRIARDLHDLLGHNLSLIALKSELAGRLLTVSPERAAREIADVESVARMALQEVREAVAGYRQPSLASELAGAGEILTAAGISYRQEGTSAGLGLPSAVDSALAWTVREGVTNVIRHSHARRCTIRLCEQTGEVSVEISDDGVASATVPGASTETAPGNGVRGLMERIEALGGHAEAGPGAGGGYRLFVRVPLERSDHAVPAPSERPPTSVAVVSSAVSPTVPDGSASTER